MALAIDTVDGRGLSNEARRVLIPNESKVTLYLLFITRQKPFNQLCITNKTSALVSRSPIPPLLHHDSYVTEDSHKTEAFNAYFSSVFTVDNGSDISTLRNSLSFCPSIIQSIEFNVEKVYNELKSLNCSKACGPDLIYLPAYLSWVLNLLLLH